MKLILWMITAQFPFLLQLIVGEAMFSLEYRRRNRFFWRCTTSLLGELVLCLLFLAIAVHVGEWLFSGVILYPVLFLITLLALALCFQESGWSIVLCGVAGYASQHIASQVCLILFGGSGQFIQAIQLSLLDMLRVRLIELIVFIAVYTMIYFLIARKANTIAPSGIRGQKVALLSAAALAVIIVLSSARDHYAQESLALANITRLFSIACGLFVLLLCSGLLEQSKLERDMEVIEQLRRKELMQYELSRESIETINLKCHDLRRQIEVFERRNGALTAGELSAIKSAISIYDTAVQTGSETLDTLLTERSLYCKRHGITLCCIADGDQLDFLTPGDVCSLFGNALDNAIEAVSQLEDEEQRIISLTVRRHRGLLSIAVDNYCPTPPKFDGDLPITTKVDDRFHGYGLKSIRQVAEKYGGEMTVAVDEIFHLAVLLPCASPE